MTRLAFTLAFAALTANAPPAAQDARSGDLMSQHYPPGALAKGQDGRVGFQVELSSNGHMERCAVTQSSGFEILDRETCDFIVQYVSFSAPPDMKGKNQRFVKSGIIEWKLPSGIQRSATPRQASLALPPALLCKQIKLTGSHVATETHCMTAREWKMQEQLTRDEIDAVQGRIFCGDHPGCQ